MTEWQDISWYYKCSEQRLQTSLKIAGELEVFHYSNHPLPIQRMLIVEKLNIIFKASDLSEKNEYSYSNINADEAFIQAPLKIGCPVEIQLYDDIDYDKCLPNGVALEFD